MTRAIVAKPKADPMLRDRVVRILDDAARMLQRASTVQQAKLIIDVAAAQKVYAKRQQLGKDVENFAYKLQIEALARLGELLKVLPKAEGTRGQLKGRDLSGGSIMEPPEMTLATTLDGLGLDKKTSMIAQLLADLPQATREAIGERETTIAEVKRQQRRARQSQALDLPAGIYRVFYADPPWAYGNRGVIGDGDNYGRAERHYPAMTIAELCDLDIKQRAADDAVLFLWVTSPLLDECWPVIRAWGFDYKSSIVWDKVRHNFGNYVSVRHEFLLICTRGSCLPDCPTPMPDSVISIERSTTHSEKPAAFRALIDQLYPRGPAIELFSRWQPPDGSRWIVFGNEVIA